MYGTLFSELLAPHLPSEIKWHLSLLKRDFLDLLLSSVVVPDSSLVNAENL